MEHSLSILQASVTINADIGCPPLARYHDVYVSEVNNNPRVYCCNKLVAIDAVCR